MRKESQKIPEPNIETRLKVAEQIVQAGVRALQAAEDEFAAPQKIARLQALHWTNLSIYAGLKAEAQKCQL